MRKKILATAAMTAVAALALSGCSTGGEETPAEGGGGLQIDVPDIAMQEELGDYEGEVNIVAWSGFVEPAWSDAFTTETGCVVNRRVAGTSDEMVQLMRTGDYDLVSASGDASLRLIAGGDVQPLNLELIPNFGDDIVEGMKGQIYDTINGKSYGIPIGRGANILQYNSEGRDRGTHQLGHRVGGGQPLRGQGHRLRRPDLHRRRRGVPDALEPTSAMHEPRTRSPEAAGMRRSTCSSSRTTSSPSTWSDPAAQITSFAGGTLRCSARRGRCCVKLTEDDKFKSVLPEEARPGV